VAEINITKHTIVWHFLDDLDEDFSEATEAANLGRGPGTLDIKFVRSVKVGDCHPVGSGSNTFGCQWLEELRPEGGQDRCTVDWTGAFHFVARTISSPYLFLLGV